MSIAVGVKMGRKVCLATDSILGSSDDSYVIGPADTKLWTDEGHKRAVAYTGSLAIGQQFGDFMAYEKGGESKSGAAPLSYFEHARGLRSVFTSFDGWLRERCPWLLQLAKDGFPLWSGACFLVAGPTGLWSIGACMSVVEVKDVHAIGIGHEAARAAARVRMSFDPRPTANEVSEMAVRYVLAHYNGVAGPVRSVVVELNR